MTMPSALSPSSPIHRRAVLLMIACTVLWSIAGVLTRHLDAARGFEVTFWRSVFAALFVAGALLLMQGKRAVNKVVSVGWLGLLSGAMWAVMFTCFMIALTMTTVANTLVVMSIAPLLTALLARVVLAHSIAPRTWAAIAVAFLGMLWMFGGGLSHAGGGHLAGMAIAFGVPCAASVNIIAMKKAGHGVDLAPAVLIGGLLSALVMLPVTWPFQASAHDLGILAVLGVFQLGLPCMMMVAASRSLSAPEISLLALLEVLLGPLWAWLWAGETPGMATLGGGAVVLAALVFNELASLRTTSQFPSRSEQAACSPSDT